MVVVRIQKIIWGNAEEHFKKHDVTLNEVETVIRSDVYIIEGHSGRKILIGKVGTRILAVIAKMSGNKVYIATARDADKEERGGFYEFQKSK